MVWPLRSVFWVKLLLAPYGCGLYLEPAKMS
jgi:hypothetical protein